MVEHILFIIYHIIFISIILFGIIQSFIIYKQCYQLNAWKKEYIKDIIWIIFTPILILYFYNTNILSKIMISKPYNIVIILILCCIIINQLIKVVTLPDWDEPVPILLKEYLSLYLSIYIFNQICFEVNEFTIYTSYMYMILGLTLIIVSFKLHHYSKIIIIILYILGFKYWILGVILCIIPAYYHFLLLKDTYQPLFKRNNL